MHARFFSLVPFLALAACGSSSSNTSPPVDASSDQTLGGDGSGGNDGSAQDGTVGDASGNDGSGDESTISDSGGDSGLGTGDASQTPCDPNDPNTCAMGLKCCAEPNHLEGGTSLQCVKPNPDGSCPQHP